MLQLQLHYKRCNNNTIQTFLAILLQCEPIPRNLIHNIIILSQKINSCTIHHNLSSFEPLSTPTLYIFIHQNRANPMTMWTKCPKNPTIYNYSPPFSCCSIAVPPIAWFDSLKSFPIVCSIPYSKFLLLFYLLWCRSQNLTKTDPKCLSNRPSTITCGLSRATQVFFNFSMNLSNVYFVVATFFFTSISFCKIMSTISIVTQAYTFLTLSSTAYLAIPWVAS
jgi:hypothetical protein